MKALVIQPAFLGDAVISLSLAEELRRISPDSNIAYLVRPEVSPIMKLSPSVDKVFIYDKYHSESGLSGIKSKSEELNNEGFDVIFNLHNSKRTRMLIERLNAPQKIGYGQFEIFTHKLTELNEPRTVRAIRLLQAIFPNASLTTLPKLIPIDALFPEEVKVLPRPIIAIAPDSVWKTKQWGKDKFHSLINMLNRQNKSIILIGSNNRFGLENIGKSLGNNIIDLTAKTSLEALVSVISYCDLLISNDSAPVHIATATGTPSIVIYGPTVPEFGFAPPPELGLIIQNEELWCRPCASHGSNECPIHTHECMTTIHPHYVVEMALNSLTYSKHGA